MTDYSGIEWCGPTWNIAMGCVKKTIEIDGATVVRPECQNCYMYRDMRRYGRRPEIVTRTKQPTFNRPLLWDLEAKNGDRSGVDRLVFTCSWTDWFNPEIDGYRAEAWDIIRRCDNLIFQILTKLPQRITPNLPSFWNEIKGRVWLGMSAGIQPALDEGVAYLLSVDAAVRFLSVEPLLGPVDLTETAVNNILNAHRNPYGRRIDWVIGGGESGDKARPTELHWARQLRDSCAHHSVPFFWKQHGEWIAYNQIPQAIEARLIDKKPKQTIGDATYVRLGRKLTGRTLDEVIHNDFPKQQMPTSWANEI